MRSVYRIISGFMSSLIAIVSIGLQAQVSKIFPINGNVYFVSDNRVSIYRPSTGQWEEVFNPHPYIQYDSWWIDTSGIYYGNRSEIRKATLEGDQSQILYLSTDPFGQDWIYEFKGNILYIGAGLEMSNNRTYAVDLTTKEILGYADCVTGIVNPQITPDQRFLYSSGPTRINLDTSGVPIECSGYANYFNIRAINAESGYLVDGDGIIWSYPDEQYLAAVGGNPRNVKTGTTIIPPPRPIIEPNTPAANPNGINHS